MRQSQVGFSIRLMLVILFISLPVSTPATRPGEQTGRVQSEESEKRTALWQALMEACPQEYREIEVYGENPALTQVCFRSKGVTLLFDARREKVEVQNHVKMLPRINRVTYREDASGGVFLLWYYGQLELSLGVGN